MLRLATSTCSALFALLLAASACSGDDDAPPLDGGGAVGGEDSGGKSGGAGRGGAANGGSEAGAAPQGGDGASFGGAGGAGGAEEALGGALGFAGEPAGAGGAAPQPDPDLVESSGGPWPDSLTGVCSNGVALAVCPQVDGPLYGQDGTYRINVPTYAATMSTLTDEVTGLVWQVLPPAQDLTLAEASTYCDELELAGQTDWRLPTRLEYVSLLDEGRGSGYALPAGMPFDATGVHWTASPSGVTPGLFFVVDDAEGTWNVVLDDTAESARCVRGAALTGVLEAAAGVVTDTMTNLTWQASELDPAPRTWAEALAHCESSSFGGKDDWRLPSIKEIATLVDEAAAAAPVIAAPFGGAERRYWSSTPAAPFLLAPAAFVLDTDFGISMTSSMGETSAARCVRTAD
ncbi:MAG: DUF1566 domain-containing protein [Myxococcales bacterium]|nr:MAG: DUF1566 domain-containing protein [Myxococcales bacterium]